jgi:hypothetical protein
MRCEQNIEMQSTQKVRIALQPPIQQEARLVGISNHFDHLPVASGRVCVDDAYAEAVLAQVLHRGF